MVKRNNLVLSVFPGIDLLGRGFEQVGYCVVRGPDPLWGGDIRTFHPPTGVFEGVIGGPPCQPFSIARTQGPATEPNLVGEFRRVIAEAQPLWYVMENVSGAHDSILSPPDGYHQRVYLLNALDFGVPQHRLRKFWIGFWGKDVDLMQYFRSLMKPRPKDYWPCITATEYKGCGTDKRRASRKVGRRLTLSEMATAFGLPEDFDLPPFKVEWKYRVIGNAVPIPLAVVIATAVKRCLTI